VRFDPTAVDGAWVIELDLIEDERGWFSRTYDEAEFSARGLEAVGVQCNLSYNATPDTLRGMHLQSEPHGEPKLVRCVRGAVYDVAVDLRAGSPSHLQWHGVELSADNRHAFYIPRGCAHGFQTLTSDCEVQYMMGAVYEASAAGGVRWDDPAFGIEWPAPRGERVIADKDLAYPDYKP
jgi:dTDP-4-dehydrorhamnose 3,5-epimerase